MAVDRAAPHNLEAERAVLGALLMNFSDALLDSVAYYVGPDDFYRTAHQAVYRALNTVKNKGGAVDPVTLADELRAAGELEKAGGAAYLADLIGAAPMAANASYYAKIVQDYSLRRRMIGAGQSLMHQAHDRSIETEAVLQNAEQSVFELSKRRKISEYAASKELIKVSFDILEKRRASKALFTGIPTQYSDLDEMLSGLQDSEMVVIGARPSMGKTALALSMAQNIAVRQKIAAGFFTLEMPAHQLMMRLLAGQAKVNSRKLRNPALLSMKELDMLDSAADDLYEAPLFIDDTPNMGLSDLRSQARRMKLKEDIKVLFIDYLGLITVDDSKMPRYEQMALVSRSLKSLARELEIPVVVLSQVRRDAEGKEPTLADLRDTGAIEQDADVVMFLHRDRLADKQDDETEVVDTKLVVAKQRNGPVGIVNLAFVPKYARFDSLDRYS